MPLGMGGGLLLGASAAAGETARADAADFTPLAIGSPLYLVVFGSVTAFTAFTWLVDTEGPSRAGSYAYINPFVAVLAGMGRCGRGAHAANAGGRRGRRAGGGADRPRHARARAVAAARGFAGDDVHRARYCPEDRGMLLALRPDIDHFEVITDER